MLTSDSGSHNEAQSILERGRKLLRLDTRHGYQQAAAAFAQAAQSSPESPTPRALQIQALAALKLRYDHRPSLSEAQRLQTPLAPAEEPGIELLKARGLVTLAAGNAVAAIAQLKEIADQNENDAPRICLPRLGVPKTDARTRPQLG